MRWEECQGVVVHGELLEGMQPPELEEVLFWLEVGCFEHVPREVKIF